MISATAEEHWGRLFYYTDMRIMSCCNCQAVPPPKHQQVSLRQLRVYWQQKKKTWREKEKEAFWFPWLIKLELWQKTVPDQEGYNHKETHQCEEKHLSLAKFFSNLSMTLCVFVLHSSYKKCFNVVSSRVRGGSVMCFLVLVFLFFTLLVQKRLSFTFLTCCLNCPVLCVQPPSLPHCDYFICIYC